MKGRLQSSLIWGPAGSPVGVGIGLFLELPDLFQYIMHIYRVRALVESQLLFHLQDGSLIAMLEVVRLEGIV